MAIDLTTPDGIFLLARDQELREEVLGGIRRYEQNRGMTLTAYIRAEQRADRTM